MICLLSVTSVDLIGLVLYVWNVLKMVIMMDTSMLSGKLVGVVVIVGIRRHGRCKDFVRIIQVNLKILKLIKKH